MWGWFLATVTAFQVGMGTYDMTGSIAVNMMGYAMPEQISEVFLLSVKQFQGIHSRQFARCFVFKTTKYFAYCSLDAGMISTNVKQRVVRNLQQRFGELYSILNVMLSCTHTHSGAAGYHDYLLYSITSLGYIVSTFDMMVTGIYEAIVRAHENISPHVALVLETDRLYNASVNRSPYAYLANPQSERDFYGSNIESALTLLRFVQLNESVVDRGSINWFSVHGTSMNNSNLLLSGDNKVSHTSHVHV